MEFRINLCYHACVSFTTKLENYLKSISNGDGGTMWWMSVSTIAVLGWTLCVLSVHAPQATFMTILFWIKSFKIAADKCCHTNVVSRRRRPKSLCVKVIKSHSGSGDLTAIARPFWVLYAKRKIEPTIVNAESNHK